MSQINSLVVSIFLFVVVSATPVPNNDVKIDDYNFKSSNGQNGYKFNYKLSDGQERTEEGNLRTNANGNDELVVSGSYQYIGPDNVEYTVIYTADETGFHPYGVHLPGSTDINAAPFPILGLPPNAIASLIG